MCVAKTFGDLSDHGGTSSASMRRVIGHSTDGGAQALTGGIMTTLRSYLDPDQQKATGPTSFLTERNEVEVRCGICARQVYVDEETYRVGKYQQLAGADNPYRCEICEDDDQDLVYRR
jgi:hypothetical protein